MRSSCTHDGSGAGASATTAHPSAPPARPSLFGKSSPPRSPHLPATFASPARHGPSHDGLAAGLDSPARVKQAITVGAGDRKDARASFSNWGPSLDLFAPGVAITSASNTSDTAKGHLLRYVDGDAARHPARPRSSWPRQPRATPAQVSKALVARAATGRISGGGPGSPDNLLQVNNP
ncbi:S8 family serine peptidase [Streptomyces avermitilis]|uniref:S8 family serine peptidase n=1 Tax=Streptomyces avermitilis TaxID=33903 RepID=UPI003F4B4BCB